ncbi:hypothetical protein CUMW_059110 [Citrus unshiu]|nr:hypothetical protein CUMW_059110 [Citrus unshiu]GAY41393.1 hypothetical protein CUMW_059110 [Citrus unshiu]GAY41394.1 hypothetical protein CUMW_059110 [Citrus unshiu]
MMVRLGSDSDAIGVTANDFGVLSMLDVDKLVWNFAKNCRFAGAGGAIRRAGRTPSHSAPGPFCGHYLSASD